MGLVGSSGTPKKGLEFNSTHHVTSDDFSASLCFIFFVGQKKVVVLEISAQTPLLQRGFPWAPLPRLSTRVASQDQVLFPVALTWSDIILFICLLRWYLCHSSM